jgi:tetratricopeptide (TPR) repeat protein
MTAFFACKSPKKLAKTIDKMELKSEPEVLEVHGDSILVTIKGKFPPHTFSKNGIVKFQPVLHYGDQEQPLKVMYLKGEKARYENAKTISYSKGGSFTYTDKVEYTPAMKKSNLLLTGQVKLDSRYDDLDQCQQVKTDSTALGTITTSLTVKPTDDVLFYEDKSPAASTMKKVIFYYVINEGRLRDTVMKGPQVRQFRSIINDSTFKFTGITFKSYASPDGEIDLNARLTQERANSAIDLAKKEFKKLDATKRYDESFDSKPDANEDWEGFKRLVSESNIAGKDDIMSIANSNMGLEEKEAALRKLPSWNELKKTILPRLRRTEVIFNGSGTLRSLEEVRAVSGTSNNYDQLSQREVMMMANASTDSAEQERMYQYYMNKYPNDWAGKNNYAAFLIKHRQYEQAHAILDELSNQYRDNDTIHNNLGVAKRFLRKYNEAKENYTDASNGGIPENNNLGILYIKYGEYDNAVQSFEADRCDYNVALAYTLKGDYETAKRKIDCIEDKTADVYYLRAIIGARSGDRELMTTSLTQAVQKDPSLRDMAKEDLEFRAHHGKDYFENAIR